MRTFVVAVLLACAWAGGAQSQTGPTQIWPTRPVRLVVPWPPGGSADMVGRLFAERLGAALQQRFIVENRPGASGTVGSAAVAHAEPDGYTFLVSGIPSHVVAPALNPAVGFDPVGDFTHIAYFGGSPIVVVAHASFGVTSLQALLARAKQSAVAISYVSSGAGSLGNLVAEFWARKEAIRLSHIPYKGGAQAVSDLIAGHAPIGFMTWTTASPHIRAGTLVPLAVSAANRMPDFSGVPTFRDLGYDDLTTATWWSLSGPPGLPRPIVERLNHEINAALETAEVRHTLAQEAIETERMSPEQFTSFVAGEVKKWGPVAKLAADEKP